MSESELVAFRRVYGLESYSWTSEESNHHRQSVSDTRVPRYHNWRTRDAQLLESWKSMKSDFRRTGFKSIGKKLMPRPRRRETLFFVCFVCVCFALFVLFGSFVVFFLCLHCDGLLDCVLVLFQHCFLKPINSTRWLNFNA